MSANQRIHGDLIKVMDSIKPVAKDKKNTQQKYSFRAVDDVYRVARAAFVEHKIHVVPEVLETLRDTKQTNSGGTMIVTLLKVKYTFYAEDGSNVACIVTGEGMDSGDKSANKALAGAYKYAMFQMFAIPLEGDKADSEYDSPEIAGGQKQPPSPPQAQSGAPQGSEGGTSAITILGEVELINKLEDAAVVAKKHVDNISNKYKADFAELPKGAQGRVRAVKARVLAEIENGERK